MGTRYSALFSLQSFLSVCQKDKELVLPPCISAANTQRCMGTQSPVLTGQRASWREIQGMYTSHLRTCFYTCSSSPAMVLHSSTNYSPSNEALFLYLFGNTTASNISTPKAYMQFFFCSHFKQNTHQLLIWIVRLPEYSNEKHQQQTIPPKYFYSTV